MWWYLVNSQDHIPDVGNVLEAAHQRPCEFLRCDSAFRIRRVGEGGGAVTAPWVSFRKCQQQENGHFHLGAEAREKNNVLDKYSEVCAYRFFKLTNVPPPLSFRSMGMLLYVNTLLSPQVTDRAICVCACRWHFTVRLFDAVQLFNFCWYLLAVRKIVKIRNSCACQLPWCDRFCWKLLWETVNPFTRSTKL